MNSDVEASMRFLSQEACLVVQAVNAFVDVSWNYRLGFLAGVFVADKRTLIVYDFWRNVRSSATPQVQVCLQVFDGFAAYESVVVMVFSLRARSKGSIHKQIEGTLRNRPNLRTALTVLLFFGLVSGIFFFIPKTKAVNSPTNNSLTLLNPR